MTISLGVIAEVVWMIATFFRGSVHPDVGVQHNIKARQAVAKANRRLFLRSFMLAPIGHPAVIRF